MPVFELPKELHPGFGFKQLPFGRSNTELDRSNHFGRHTNWAFIPGMYSPIPLSIGTQPQNYRSLGQPLNAFIERLGANSEDFKVAPFSGGNGYSGNVINFVTQTASSGHRYFFGAGNEGQIRFPNKQSLTVWACYKPSGSGSVSNDDCRALSRDSGTSDFSHYYMIGSVGTTATQQARMRFKVNGTTQTIVTSSQNIQNDALNFVVGTYDGANLTLHHFRQDGSYLSNSSPATGDISDSSSGAVKLSVGASANAVDNFLQGEILGVGSLDYAENNELMLRKFFNNITQILKPASPLFYFTPELVSGNTITANQTETGDTQAATLNSLIQITASQSEAGDSQTSNLNALAQITANQTEEGDTQAASIIAAVVANITASQTEDGDVQTASISNIIQITSNQSEAGDTQTASLNNLAQISSNQSEDGDSQSASIVNIINISANQSEAGDSQTSSINNIIQISANQSENGDVQVASIVGVLTSTISANQTEAGDSQVASLKSIAQINASQAEDGDTQSASIVGEITSIITANQTEAGDLQSATLSNVVQILANQPEAGDSQVALIGAVGIACLSGYVTIQPVLSGDVNIDSALDGSATIKPLLSGNVSFN